jgi:hypothetical protein
VQLEWDGTRDEIGFRVSAKWKGPCHSVRGWQFSRVLTTELCPSAGGAPFVSLADTQFRLLPTHVTLSPLHFPSTRNRVPCRTNRALTLVVWCRQRSGLTPCTSTVWPVSWLGGQCFWILTMRSRVRLTVLPWEFSLAGEDNHGDCVELGFKDPLGTPRSHMSSLTSSQQRNCVLWAPQPQKSVTLRPQPGGGTTKWKWTCGGTGQKKKLPLCNFTPWRWLISIAETRQKE